MYSIWLSVKENANCTGRNSDICRPRDVSDSGNQTDGEENSRRRRRRRTITLCRQHSLNNHTIFLSDCPRERYYDLNVGDPSRKVVETIFQAVSMTHSKRTKKIERVLRVKNSQDSNGSFEEYRENVKRRASSEYMKHPRSIVDGNELLRFYNTTITCCSRKLKRVSELCHNFNCGVCRIIESGFYNEETKLNGIQLSTSSDILHNKIEAVHAKKAAVICRVIAGKVVNVVEEGREEGFDSVCCSKLEQLFVRKPDALLPCFIIVWD